MLAVSGTFQAPLLLYPRPLSRSHSCGTVFVLRDPNILAGKLYETLNCLRGTVVSAVMSDGEVRASSPPGSVQSHLAV